MTALASATDVTDLGYGTLVRGIAPPALDKLVARASRTVESKCTRRFAPFTITESVRADGIDPAAIETAGWPLDLIAALGQSRSRAYGESTLVRDVWLSEYAPIYPELWTYSNVSIVLARAFGDTQDVLASSLEGPEPDSGHFRFRLGTFVPIGTTVRITYSGGYTVSIPDDLVQATVMQTALFAVLAAEPQQRKDFKGSLDELKGQIDDLLCPYQR